MERGKEQEMEDYGHMVFILDSINEKTSQEHMRNAGQLKEILAPFGFEVVLSGTNLLSIRYSSEEVNRKRTRNAGRKKDYSLIARHLTYGQVKEMKKEKGVSETIRELGMGRRTFFGRMKKYREKGYPDDALFY